MEVPKYSAPNALMLRRVQHGRQGFTAGTCTERSWKVMVNGAVLRWEVGGLVDSSMNCSVGLFSMISRLDHKKNPNSRYQELEAPRSGAQLPVCGKHNLRIPRYSLMLTEEYYIIGH